MDQDTAPSNESRSAIPQPVLVVDDDETMTMLLRDFLESMGVSAVEIAHDGESAWQQMQGKTFGLVVLDWRLPKVSGLTLFNRMRTLPQYANAPICISSGLLTQEDCFLLEEFPTTRLIEKPYTEELFVECVEKLVMETAWQANNIARLDELISGMVQADQASLGKLQEMLKSSPNPAPLAMSAAKVMRERKCYRESEALLRRLLERDPRSILALSELGKVLHAQGRSAEALPLLLKAQERSPKNLNRLCLLGEIELGEGDSAAAAKYFKQALSIDSKDEKANAGAMTAENLKAVPAEQRGSPQMMKSMAGLLNITAISLIRQGQHDKGIAQYKGAFHFLSDDQDKARIAFNLGLAFMRAQKISDATHWFQESVKFSQGQFVKAQEYLDKLKKPGASEDVAKSTNINDEMVTI